MKEILVIIGIVMRVLPYVERALPAIKKALERALPAIKALGGRKMSYPDAVAIGLTAAGISTDSNTGRYLTSIAAYLPEALKDGKIDNAEVWTIVLGAVSGGVESAAIENGIGGKFAAIENDGP